MSISSEQLVENRSEKDQLKDAQRSRPEILAMPDWLRRPIGKASELSAVQKVIKQRQIHTICEEGRCPNRGECYANQTATFLLMGPTCTRSCAFCQVDKGHSPMPLDPTEPAKVAESVKLLDLKYVVLTAVARDDLADGGASWFVKTMEAVRAINPQTQIEVLTPDFWGGADAPVQQRQRVETVAIAHPTCFNHNVETVKRLQGPVRRGAKYGRSLDVLRYVKEIDPSIPTKSGLMVGHGETRLELVEAMKDLRAVKCDRLTIGQYMRPSLAHLPVQKYWTPAEFDQLGAIARDLGFSHVRSGPLVRSSYHAGEQP
ncbi:lipoyl synthase [cf. Phormidesmis sp. LEGE 11477]|uniref:lipoyl synthase n=1 Tax=cf. Phormidesmis sp. LEGE 11477 TaxID=1828680 RepID=UPI001880CC95|nr:lipoyl synthase [cf. Phormidesmis sp. LEGE 11477]MBE9062536.1 lipoyl synthase [cf. Phormidesmis sp. LEGE 11477]